jgi:hypothetical protein
MRRHVSARPRHPVSGTVELVLGGILAVLCLPCSAIGGGMMALPSKPEDFQSGVIVLVFSLVVFDLPVARASAHCNFCGQRMA